MAWHLGTLEGQHARRRLGLHDGPDLTWGAVNRALSMPSATATTYPCRKTVPPISYVAPAQASPWRVGLEVICAAETHPYKNGQHLGGTIYAGGVSATTSWDEYALDLRTPSGVLRQTFFLNYSPTAIGINPRRRSTLEFLMSPGETITLRGDTRDGVTSACREDASRENITFARLPTGWESGVVVRLILSP